MGFPKLIITTIMPLHVLYFAGEFSNSQVRMIRSL
jgi:hypothetical protein